jgi:hypothetical protein
MGDKIIKTIHRTRKEPRRGGKIIEKCHNTVNRTRRGEMITENQIMNNITPSGLKT